MHGHPQIYAPANDLTEIIYQQQQQQVKNQHFTN